jgi:hypothetical protein
VRAQVSYSYKTTGNIIVLYILNSRKKTTIISISDKYNKAITLGENRTDAEI